MMVNVKLGKEIRKDVMFIMSRARDKEKKSESPTGIEPMTLCIPVGCSNHSATGAPCLARPFTWLYCDTRLAYCQDQQFRKRDV